MPGQKRTPQEPPQREPTEAKYELVDVIDYEIRYPEDTVSMTIFPEDTVLQEGDGVDLIVMREGIRTCFYRERRLWITRRERQHRRVVSGYVPSEAPGDPDPQDS